MPVKLADKVAVHPRWGTIHEVHKGYKNLVRCGNPLDYYQIMTRRKAEKIKGTKPCQSQACVKARA